MGDQPPFSVAGRVAKDFLRAVQGSQRKLKLGTGVAAFDAPMDVLYSEIVAAVDTQKITGHEHANFPPFDEQFPVGRKDVQAFEITDATDGTVVRVWVHEGRLRILVKIINKPRIAQVSPFTWIPLKESP